MTSRLDQWLEVLGGEEFDLTPHEIADMCWLALIQHQFGVEQPPPPPEATPPVVPKPKGSAEREAGRPPESSILPSGLPPRRSPESAGGLFPRNTASAPKTEIKTLRVPTAPALRDPLPLARALRPLMQQWPIGQGSALDEAATVRKIAEEKVWWPVTKPQTETWLELALVVDESPSMLIWRRTIEELERFFKHYGFFRDVRMWGLIAKPVPVKRAARSRDQASPTQTSATGAGDQTQTKICLRATPFARFNTQDLRQPDSLIDPTGRRVVLIVSDCVDSIWRDPELLSTFKLWSSRSPLAILQMMPEWLWPRTNLRQGTVVNFKGKTKGSTNPILDVVLADAAYYRKTRAEKQVDIKVPVITLEADRVESWAKMLTAQGPHQAAGVILNPKAQQMTVATQQRRQQKASDAASAAYKAQAFRGYTSPVSRRLASLLAASPAITLPVIRVVQETLVPQSEQVHVAEVLLGGILRPQQEPALGTNPDDVQYEFVDPDIRAELLAEAPVKDTTEVLSRYIQDNFNTSLYDFILELRRLMQTETTEAEELKPIATIAAEVLQYRGMEYADFVQEVKARYEPDPTPETDEPPLPIFPEFEEFDFIDASFIDEPDIDPELIFPPPLQPIDFSIITVEHQQNSEIAQNLEFFEFTVATLQRRSARWEIRRQQQQAYRFIEVLPKGITLDMVAIPSGTFLMGSPKDEPKRDASRESPQHEVTVAAFFMGRYPVTQAQWRAVVQLPQIERTLKPNPSRFKGDHHPVERATWDDATEFCARLSAHTGRDYRLPTEAEWEYACRAGTTTPFNFGETISSELANYRGSTVYANGPQGESRGKTTPVDHFGIANAFGLSDMHGNVDEWCQDHWHENYKGAPADGSAWIEGGNASYRVRRGGSWDFNPRYCRSAYRYWLEPGDVNINLGFRVCCSAPRALP
jgi:formylglycine-generating enzyme required for sulfatase activity